MLVNIIKTEHDLELYLNTTEKKLEEINNRLSKLTYQRYLDKKPNNQIAINQQERAKIMLDPHLHNCIAEWQGKVTKPVLARRIEVWADHLLLAQVESQPEIMEVQRNVSYNVMKHGYLVNQKRISLGEVRAIVRANPDKHAREVAWRAHTELHQSVKEDMLKLFRLRNHAAQELGFDTYVDLRLEKNGNMTRPTVEKILNELTTDTQNFYTQLIEDGARKLQIDEIDPWDIQYILEQQGGVPTKHFPKTQLNLALEDWANHMGFSLKDYGIEAVITDIPYNGLTMGLDRQHIKILANPSDGYTYYQTHFHELGHALHSALKKVEHPILRRESGIFNEGMAEVFGYIPSDIKWLEYFHHLNETIAKQALASTIGPKFHYLRQRTAYCLFEFEAYKNLDQDLDALMATTEAQLLHCKYDLTPRWASNGWYVNYPVYWQNYVLADVVASQIHHHLKANVGSLTTDVKALAYIVNNYIAQGALIPWLDKVALATGKALSAQALISDLLDQ